MTELAWGKVNKMQFVRPRYDDLAESVEEYVLDMLRDQLNRRQPMDNVSRNLLRLLTATCGYKEVRQMAVQRLEMWLQNPKVRMETAGPQIFWTWSEIQPVRRVPFLFCVGRWLQFSCSSSAVDQASAGLAHVCLYELQHSQLRGHGSYLQPDQNSSQAKGPSQPLHAVCQVSE